MSKPQIIESYPNPQFANTIPPEGVSIFIDRNIPLVPLRDGQILSRRVPNTGISVRISFEGSEIAISVEKPGWQPGVVKKEVTYIAPGAKDIVVRVPEARLFYTVTN